LLLSSTYAVQLRNNQRQLTSVHGFATDPTIFPQHEYHTKPKKGPGPIAPVTFKDKGTGCS